VRTHAFAHLSRFAADSLRHVANRESLYEMAAREMGRHSEWELILPQHRLRWRPVAAAAVQQPSASRVEFRSSSSLAAFGRRADSPCSAEAVTNNAPPLSYNKTVSAARRFRAAWSAHTM
jgi:hypothetical protein